MLHQVVNPSLLVMRTSSLLAWLPQRPSSFRKPTNWPAPCLPLRPLVLPQLRLKGVVKANLCILEKDMRPLVHPELRRKGVKKAVSPGEASRRFKKSVEAMRPLLLPGNRRKEMEQAVRPRNMRSPAVLDVMQTPLFPSALDLQTHRGSRRRRVDVMQSTAVGYAKCHCVMQYLRRRLRAQM